MIRVVFSDNVEVFADDLELTETYRSAEVLRRWNHVVETPGIVAKDAAADVLFPTTGSGEIAVSAGGAYMPNGEYVQCTGASLTGLTDTDMFATGETYIAVQQSEVTGNTRPDIITADMLPTRAWNAQDENSLALVNAATGNTFITLAKVDNITVGGEVTLNTDAIFRPLLRISDSARPTQPGNITVTTGPEEDFIHTGAGTTARRVESTLSYVEVGWTASTHDDGILAYYVRLNTLDNTDAQATGKTFEQLLLVGGGAGPAFTGVTFHNLTPGLKLQPEIYAIANTAVPVISSATTASTFFIGSGTTSGMSALSVTQRASGFDVSWTPSETGTTGITLYEVFASENTSVTGGSVDYSTLIYRGYGARAFVPGDIGQTIYYRVRGVYQNGLVTSGDQIGSVVLTGPAAPTTPENVLLVEVRPLELEDLVCSTSFKDTYFSMALLGGLISDEAYTRWEWNWNDVEGSGGAGIFDATNITGATLDQMVGLHLWLSSITTDYIITGNTASSGSNVTIGITDLLGQPVDITGVIATSVDPAIVHSDADEYEVEFQTFSDEVTPVEQPARRERKYITRADSPLIQKVELPLRIGSRIKCGIRAVSRASRTPSSQATSSLDRIIFPDVESWNTGATLSSVSTEYGFEITITPNAVLEEISAVEIAYKLGSSGVSFSNREHNVQIVDPRSSIRVPVERAGTYQFAVRPLKSGQVVGNTLTTIIASGGGGFLPNIKELLVDIRMRPNDQFIVYDTGSTGLIWVSGESGSAVSSGNPARWVEDKLLEFSASGNNYVFFVLDQRPIVVDGVYKNFLDLQERTTVGTDLETLFYSGHTVFYQGREATGTTIQQARQVALISISNDINIINLSFDPTYTDGSDVDPGILRVYQQSFEAGATSIEINSFSDILVNDADLDIQQARGALTLVVDAYDPSSVSANTKTIIGKLTIQYRDKSTRTALSDAGAGGFPAVS